MPKTGETCQQSGIYKNDCATVEHRREIALSKGETFPPCHGCKRAVTWTLVRVAK